MHVCKLTMVNIRAALRTLDRSFIVAFESSVCLTRSFVGSSCPATSNKCTDDSATSSSDGAFKILKPSSISAASLAATKSVAFFAFISFEVANRAWAALGRNPLGFGLLALASSRKTPEVFVAMLAMSRRVRLENTWNIAAGK
jgi:hypothetical protein